ncbi:hypothetical protein [Haladaptatus pallidirubidus]
MLDDEVGAMSNLLLCPECGWTGSKNDRHGTHVCPVCDTEIDG